MGFFNKTSFGAFLCYNSRWFGVVFVGAQFVWVFDVSFPLVWDVIFSSDLRHSHQQGLVQIFFMSFYIKKRETPNKLLSNVNNFIYSGVCWVFPFSFIVILQNVDYIIWSAIGWNKLEIHSLWIIIKSSWLAKSWNSSQLDINSGYLIFFTQITKKPTPSGWNKNPDSHSHTNPSHPSHQVGSKKLLKRSRLTNPIGEDSFIPRGVA